MKKCIVRKIVLWNLCSQSQQILNIYFQYKGHAQGHNLIDLSLKGKNMTFIVCLFAFLL